MKSNVKGTKALICAALFLTLTAQTADASESNWRLGVGLGWGERTNPLIFSLDLPILVDFDIAWFGERFFFDNGDIGYTFLNGEKLSTNFVVRYNSDRAFFGKTESGFITVDIDPDQGIPIVTRFQVPDRDYAIEAGVEILSSGPWGNIQASLFHDISSAHDGFELDVNYGYGLRSKRWYIEPSVGVSFKSAELNNYYWGFVDESFDFGQDVRLPTYEASSGFNMRTRIAASYYFSRHWAFTAVAEYERINNEANNSPIVTDDEVIGYFAGIRYRF